MKNYTNPDMHPLFSAFPTPNIPEIWISAVGIEECRTLVS